MKQRRGNRKLSSMQTTKDNPHKGKFYQDHTYTKILWRNATTTEASSGRTQDIRGQWRVNKKIRLWFATRKDDLLKIGLALNKTGFDADNVIIEAFLPDD